MEMVSSFEGYKHEFCHVVIKFKQFAQTLMSLIHDYIE